MKIFTVNCGSSSVKFKLFEMHGEELLAGGMVERVGTSEARMEVKFDGNKLQKGIVAEDHTEALKVIIETLVGEDTGVISDVGEIGGVGHRVVHGGEDVSGSSIINDELISVIEHNAALAPLHNPPNLMGIRGAMDIITDAEHVAVFDTSFYSTLPPKAYRYAVPDDWYTKHKVRKYGFHGTSHRYVTQRAAEIAGKKPEEVNLITCHLGNGCSITAIEGGKAVEHSMGLTPLEGLIMGTRSGDIDPAVPLYMISKGLDPKDIDKLLNKESGLKGISKISNDMRDLVNRRADGDEAAALAMDMYVHRLIKYIGSYYAVLPSTDMIVLTGGIGENSIPVRKMLCEGLSSLGVSMDEQVNESTIGGMEAQLTDDASKLPVWIVPTNEELMIARDTLSIVAG